MMRSLFSGVAGLKTHQVKMDVIGNNIANVNTTSFKSQSITFSDLMYQTTQRASRATETTGGINARQIGLGAKSGAIATAITQQGATETTNNPFDMRITGDAFYIVNDGNQTMYTRDGSFYIDGAGNLAMQSTGYFVYGWTAVEDETTGEISVNTNGGVGKLQLMSAENMTYPPEGTTEAVVSGNIDAHDTNITSDSGKTVTLEFYDNLGYLYTAKFAVRDVNDLEHTYTMTLEDILDSKGNTIGAEKLSYVTFTDGDNEEANYGVRNSWTKTVTTINYTATVGAKNVTFRNPSGSTAYSGIPASGSISSLVEKAPTLLRNVYNLTVGLSGDNTVASTDYYTINENGSISVFPVDPSDKDPVNLGQFFKNASTDTTITYGTYSNSSYATVPRSVEVKSADQLSDKQMEVLNTMFGLDISSLDFSDDKTYTYQISSDGVSSLTLTTNSYSDETVAIKAPYDMVSSTGTTITFNDTNSGSDITVDLATTTFSTGLPTEILKVYGLKSSDYKSQVSDTSYKTFAYSIDATTGALTVTTKLTTNNQSVANGNIGTPTPGTEANTINFGSLTDVPVSGEIKQSQTDLLAALGVDQALLPAQNTTGDEAYTYNYTINASTGDFIITKQTVKTTESSSSSGYSKTSYTFKADTTNNKAIFNDRSDDYTYPLEGTLYANDATSLDLLRCYGMTATDIPASEGNASYSYKYSINKDTGEMTITKTTMTKSEEGAYVNDKEYAVYLNTGSNIVYRNHKSEVDTAVPLSGTVASLTNSQRNVLSSVYGYTPAGDDVTYSISDDGSKLTIGTMNTAGVVNYQITSTTKETQLTFEVEVDETTATFKNASEEGKTVYDAVPRTGYVSEINDASATSDFFADVYNYTPDATAENYETLTYHILDDGSLQIVNNSITLKYNAKTGDIIQPEGKITLNFQQDAVIDGQPKMAGFTDVNMDLSSTTNYNTMATSTIGAVKGDLASLKTGRAVGTMNGMTVSKDGTIYATYSNGQTKLLGQIATAEFANASGLEKQGDNLYCQTLNSGEAKVQDVTSDGGYITTGVLEMSNVDLSSEFTSMITTQRGFQANSRIITVSDTLLEELTNLKR
jgi:flagellar hook protein FlgE